MLHKSYQGSSIYSEMLQTLSMSWRAAWSSLGLGGTACNRTVHASAEVLGALRLHVFTAVYLCKYASIVWPRPEI